MIALQVRHNDLRQILVEQDAFGHEAIAGRQEGEVKLCERLEQGRQVTVSGEISWSYSTIIQAYIAWALISETILTASLTVDISKGYWKYNLVVLSHNSTVVQYYIQS